MPMHSPLSTILAAPLAVLLLLAFADVASAKSKKMKNPGSDMSLKVDDAAPKIVLDRQAKHRRLKKKRASGQ